jgi:hypothetical protein
MITTALTERTEATNARKKLEFFLHVLEDFLLIQGRRSLRRITFRYHLYSNVRWRKGDPSEADEPCENSDPADADA